MEVLAEHATDMPSYQNLLTSLRQAFPQPISDPVHDGYVVFSIFLRSTRSMR